MKNNSTTHQMEKKGAKMGIISGGKHGRNGDERARPRKAVFCCNCDLVAHVSRGVDGHLAHNNPHVIELRI
jgi:hypothetical protein